MNLRRKAATGFVWVGLSSFSVQIFGLLASIFLARLLNPRDFGLVTLAMVVISLSNIFSELGFGGTIVQFPEIDKKTADTAFILNLGISLLLGLLVAGASSKIAGIFHENQLAPILTILALNIVLASTRVVPSNLLERNLEFRRKLVAEVTPPILYGLVALSGAILGWGVWSLVAGTIAASLAQTSLIWWISKYRPSWKFDPEVAKRLWRFGQHLIYASLLLFLAANLDQVYIGRFIDVSQVGFYGLALTLGNLSTDYVADLFGRVLAPAFARVQKDLARLEEAYFTSERYISYLALPICAGIFVTAPIALRVIYGEKWVASIPLIRILCFYGLFRALGRLTGTFFTAVGKPYVSVRIIVLRVLVLSLAILALGSRLGAAGVAISLTISMAVSVLWSLHLVNLDLKAPTFRIIQELIPQALAAILMGIAVAGIAQLLPVSLLALVLMILAGAGLYALLALLFGRGKVLQDASEIRRLLFHRQLTPVVETVPISPGGPSAREEEQL